MTTRRRHREVFGALSLVFGSLLIGLLLTEAGYQIARHFVCIGTASGSFEPRSWGWTHRRNATVVTYTCMGREFEYRTRTTFNSQGLRDRDFSYTRAPGVKRVLLLGDSITEALQVPLESTFAKQAEAMLQQRGASVEIINAGHAGFGLDNQLLFYREEGRRYAADLVLFVFNFHNDILESSYELYRRSYEQGGLPRPLKPWFTFGTDGALILHREEAQAPPVRRGLDAMASRFYLFRMIRRMVESPTPAAPAVAQLPVHYEEFAPFDASWTDAWNLTTRLIAELRTEVERNGSRFAMILVPSREMAAPIAFHMRLAASRIDTRQYDLDRPRKLMGDFLRMAGIPFLDLTNELQREGSGGPPPFFALDVHLTARGHEVVTTPIADFIEARLPQGN